MSGSRSQQSGPPWWEATAPPAPRPSGRRYIPWFVGGAVVLVVVVVSVLWLAPSSEDGTSASSLSAGAAQTTPLGCELDGDAADIDCTEREVISGLCGQDATGWPAPRRSNLNSSGPGLHTSDWFDSTSYGQLDRRANFQYRLQQGELAAVSLICTPGGVQHIDLADWYVLVTPGAPADLPPAFR